LEDNLILVKGAVPGARSGWVLINDAVKKSAPEGVPLPAGLREMPKTEETPKVEEVSVSESPKSEEE